MKLSGSTKKLVIRVILFLLYLVIGAGIFFAIEKDFEEEQRKRAYKFVDKVKNLTARNFSGQELKKFMLDFQHALRYGYNIETNDLNSQKWAYMNSFYFVGNIVTTIGKYQWLLLFSSVVWCMWCYHNVAAFSSHSPKMLLMYYSHGNRA